MGWDWYSVRTIYRTIAIGSPKSIDKHYDPEATMVEERVVLFKARSFSEAIIKAEKDANKYANEINYNNPYGQRIKQKYLGICDAFILNAEPREGVEVYSSTEIVGRNVSNKSIGDNKLGPEVDNKTDYRRKKFLNSEFSGVVDKGA